MRRPQGFDEDNGSSKGLDVFRSDGTVVDTIVDKLVLGVGAEIRDLNFVIESVVKPIVFPHCRREEMGWNTRKICINFDERDYWIYWYDQFC